MVLMKKVVVGLISFFSIFPLTTIQADVPGEQQVQLRTPIAEVDRTKLRDYGFSFYVGTPIYRQSNDNLLFHTITNLGGNTSTHHVDTKYNPGLTFGGGYFFDSKRELQLNVTTWNHTDTSKLHYYNNGIPMDVYGNAKLDYHSIDALFGNNSLITTQTCGFGFYGGFIYADAHRIASTNIGINNILSSRNIIDNEFSAFGPMLEALVSMRPILSQPNIIIEADVRGGLLYSNKRAHVTDITYNQNGQVLNNTTQFLDKVNGGSTYVRYQAAAYYEVPANGSTVRVGGGWQARQYQSAILEFQPQVNNNLDVQGPFITIRVVPTLVGASQGQSLTH
jgi:Legionella pneumophila major outer membrane protein precursor